MRKPVQSNAEEGSEAVFARNAANVGPTNVVGRLGRSSLNSLASNVLRYSAFIGHIEYSAKGGGVRARKRDKMRA